MFKKVFSLASTALISLSLSSCSENIAEMPLNKQSLYQPNRYTKDKENDKTRYPQAILDLSTVKPGNRVLDLLGGGGYYTELFNYIVGDTGKVYIQNNSLFLRFSKKELDKRLINNRLKNVIRLDTEFANMKLPSDIDLIFIGLSYHDIYVPRDDPTIMTSREEFFPQIYAALKPGGKLLITDHAAKIGSGKTMAPSLHRIDEQWAIKDIESAGFKLIATSDVLRNPKDDHTLDIWKKKFYHKTDRFVHLYKKIVTKKN